MHSMLNLGLSLDFKRHRHLSVETFTFGPIIHLHIATQAALIDTYAGRRAGACSTTARRIGRIDQSFDTAM